MLSTRTLGSFAGLVLLALLAAPTYAQNTPPGGAPQPGQGGQPGGGRGNFDPAQFRQRMLDRVKQQLGATDEEFTALQPKIEAVYALQRDARGGRGFGGNRRGGQGGQTPPPTADPNAPAPSATAAAAAALQTTLDNKDASPDEIKTKLAALRDAKTAAKEKLTKAQEDLKSLLTQRQEAILVQDGLLE